MKREGLTQSFVCDLNESSVRKESQALLSIAEVQKEILKTEMYSQFDFEVQILCHY